MLFKLIWLYKNVWFSQSDSNNCLSYIPCQGRPTEDLIPTIETFTVYRSKRTYYNTSCTFNTCCPTNTSYKLFFNDTGRCNHIFSYDGWFNVFICQKRVGFAYTLQLAKIIVY